MYDFHEYVFPFYILPPFCYICSMICASLHFLRHAGGPTPMSCLPSPHLYYLMESRSYNYNLFKNSEAFAISMFLACSSLLLPRHLCVVCFSSQPLQLSKWVLCFYGSSVLCWKPVKGCSSYFMHFYFFWGVMVDSFCLARQNRVPAVQRVHWKTCCSSVAVLGN